MPTKRAKHPNLAIPADIAAGFAGSCADLISSPRTSVVFPKVLQVASRLFPSDAVALWVREDHNWQIALSTGLSDHNVASSEIADRLQPPAHLSMVVVEEISGIERIANRRDFYTAERIKSFVAVPVLVRQELRGTITFYFRKQRRFSEEDKVLVSSVADLAGAAIATAELYEKQARLTAEAGEARARYKFLSDLSGILAASLDYSVTLGELARAMVPTIADWCAIDILAEDGSLDRLAVAHKDPRKMQLAREMQRKFPVNWKAPRGLGHVLRTGEATFTPVITDAMFEQSPIAPEQLDILRKLGVCSSVMVAMIARGRVLGAITVVQAESNRHFVESDVPFLQDIANRAALYLDNFQLLAQRAAAPAKATK